MDVSDPHELPRRLAVAEAVVAHLPDPVVLVDASGFVEGANAAARALLPTLAVGRPLSYGLRAPEVLDAVAAALPGGPVKVEFATRVPTERTFEVQITPALEANGEFGAYGMWAPLSLAATAHIVVVGNRSFTHSPSSRWKVR